MKKIVVVVLLIIAVASVVYAQSATTNPVVNATTGSTVVARNKMVNYEGHDTTALGAWGTDVTGSVGFLVLKACNSDGSNCYPYYIWINASGNLQLASYVTLSAFASFPNGNWNGGAMGSAGTKVGGQ